MATKKKAAAKKEPIPYVATNADENSSFQLDGAMMVKDKKDLVAQIEDFGELPEPGETWKYNVYEFVGVVEVKGAAITVEDQGIFDGSGAW